MKTKDLKLFLKTFAKDLVYYSQGTSEIKFQSTHNELFRVKISAGNLTQDFCLSKDSFSLLLDFLENGEIKFTELGNIEIKKNTKQLNLAQEKSKEPFPDIPDLPLINELPGELFANIQTELFLLPNQTLTFFENFKYSTRVDYFAGRSKCEQVNFENLELQPTDLSTIHYLHSLDKNLIIQNKEKYYELITNDIIAYLPKMNVSSVVDPFKKAFEKNNFLFAADINFETKEIFNTIRDFKVKDLQNLYLSFEGTFMILKFESDSLILEEKFQILKAEGKSDQKFKFSDAKLFSSVILKLEDFIHLKFFSTYLLLSSTNQEYLISYASA